MGQRILLVCMRRIGDVLLATPIPLSIRSAWPDAQVDMLVFSGTEGVLRGNPDIANVIAVPEGAGAADTLRLAARLWRRYDVAISVQTGDRPTFMAWAAGRRCIGFVEAGAQSWWKRRVLDARVPASGMGEHAVAGNLRLLEPLGVAPIARVRAHWDDDAPRRAREAFPMIDLAAGIAVLHVSPKFPYKAWTAQGWADLARWISERGLTPVIAGGASEEERAFLAQLAPRLPVGTVDVSGKVDLAALAYIVSRAKVYVGTDTAVTHMAAALDVPTVALFGPSSPVKWGPWPEGLAADAPTPWAMRGSQMRGNVILIQGQGDCVPCLGEGCDKHVRSLSDCLQHMQASTVIDAVARKLDAQ